MLRSLISVVDTGSITETARRLGRTQPAISLQIRRLEDITGKVLFQHEGRRMALTPDGDMVLAYAKSILRLHDELLSRLSSPEVHGHVVLGTPDLYAAYMLPSILSVFKEAFPRIQVELRCALSTPTVDRVQRGEVDVALVTRMNNFTGGLVVHQERLVWIVGEHSRAQFEDPVRLALLPRHDQRPRLAAPGSATQIRGLLLHLSPAQVRHPPRSGLTARRRAVITAISGGQGGGGAAIVHLR